jgi:hypothetical protein
MQNINENQWKKIYSIKVFAYIFDMLDVRQFLRITFALIALPVMLILFLLQYFELVSLPFQVDGTGIIFSGIIFLVGLYSAFRLPKRYSKELVEFTGMVLDKKRFDNQNYASKSFFKPSNQAKVTIDEEDFGIPLVCYDRITIGEKIKIIYNPEDEMVFQIFVSRSPY